MIEERVKELEKAAKSLEVLSQDEEAREIYEARQKAIHDHVTNLKEARKEAKKETRKETKAEIARNLLDVLDIETISAKIGLSVEEVKKLKEE